MDSVIRFANVPDIATSKTLCNRASDMLGTLLANAVIEKTGFSIAVSSGEDWFDAEVVKEVVERLAEVISDATALGIRVEFDVVVITVGDRSITSPSVTARDVYLDPVMLEFLVDHSVSFAVSAYGGSPYVPEPSEE